MIGGHFGMLDGIDVQIDEKARINKRLRSMRHWKKRLKECGFSSSRFIATMPTYGSGAHCLKTTFTSPIREFGKPVLLRGVHQNSIVSSHSS